MGAPVLFTEREVSFPPELRKLAVSIEQATIALRRSVPTLAQVEMIDHQIRQMRERYLSAVPQACGPPVGLSVFARRADCHDRLIAAVRTALADLVTGASSTEQKRTPGLDDAIAARWAEHGDPAREGGEGWKAFRDAVCAASGSRACDRTIQRRVRKLKLRDTTKG